MTRALLAGLIGQGISNSRTPGMHEAEGRALGLDYRYDRLDVDAAPFADMTLDQIITWAEAAGYAGVNITHPFKIDAVALASRLSPEAQVLGAINTMVFRDGLRIGHNTDYTGFQRALRQDLGPQPKAHVMLVGAGGAGTAVALALIDEGVLTLYLFDQNRGRVRSLADRLRAARPQARLVLLDSPYDVAPLSGVVNATPLGMAKYPGMSVDPARFDRSIWCADIVYVPLHTQFIQAAGKHGCVAMTGAGMAVFQAVAAFELITGHIPDAMRMLDSFARLDPAAPPLALDQTA